MTEQTLAISFLPRHVVWCLALMHVGCGADDEPECPGRSDGEMWCDGGRALVCDTDYEDCSSGYCDKKSVVRLSADCGSSGNECHAGECVLPELSCTGSVCVDGAVHDCLDGRVKSDGTPCGAPGRVCAIEWGNANCVAPPP